MVVPPTSSLRAIRGSPAERALWTKRLGQWPTDGPPGLEVLKAGDQVGVYALGVDGRPVVLKCWRLSTIAHRAYAALRTTRGSRQWRGSRRLKEIGLRTPRSLALIRGRSGRDLVEVLIMERLDGRTLLEHLARPTLTPRAEHRVATTLALQCHTMLRAGIFNRDHKPSNLMVLHADQSIAEIAILDAVAIRPFVGGGHGHAPPFERLVLEAIGVGTMPRRSLMARFVREWTACIHQAAGPPQREATRALWAQIASRIRDHGDPTPTDNPLSAAR